MSAPKPELTAELRAASDKCVVELHDNIGAGMVLSPIVEALVREVVEIVARKDAEIVTNVDRHNKYRKLCG